MRDMGGLVLVALAIAVGLAGIIVPILPGMTAGVRCDPVWAIVDAHRELGDPRYRGGPVRRGEVVKYTWPVNRMRAAEVGTGA